MTGIAESRELLATLDRVLDRIPEGCTADVRLSTGRTVTMRYANSIIHQPHFQLDQSISVRIEQGRHLGTATTTDLSDRSVDQVISEAVHLARAAPVERRFLGFPKPGSKKSTPNPFSRSTAELSPERLARMALEAIAGAQHEAPGGRVSGVMNAGGGALAVGNTSGLRRAQRRSFVQGTVLVDRPEVDPPPSGWSEGAHWSVDQFDAARIGREAGARVPRAPVVGAPPGEYRVVLRGPAAMTLLQFLGNLGFGGHGEEEGWSCLRGRRGRKLFPTWFGLRDDASTRTSMPAAIDYEGTPKRPTPLIRDGRAGPAVTDLLTAGRLRSKPSGHALPPEAPWGEWGPIPSNLVVDGGTASEDDLVREVASGVLVTRFHYVRVVHPGRGEITGMTRDGTYRIENGEVVAPIRNLRFTDSVVGAVERLLSAGRERRCYADETGDSAVTCPALAIDGFRFTSATLF